MHLQLYDFMDLMKVYVALCMHKYNTETLYMLMISNDTFIYKQ